MRLLNFNLNLAGQPGLTPKFIFFDTNDTVAQVTTAGYLNNFVQQGNKISETDMAVVATRATPNAKSAAVNLFNVTYSGGDWSFTSNSTPLSLADGQIFVGNSGGVATGVTMSGDATISDTGVLTIANLAVTAAKLAANAVTTAKILDANVTTAKILDANVTLAKLASGITPSHVVKFAGLHTTAGGSASESFTVTGAVSGDLPFIQMIDNGTANVTVVQAAVGTNLLSVTFSADPGNDTVIAYQLLRAAS